MKKAIKWFIRLLLEVVVVTFILVGLRIFFTDGMWLLEIPNLNDVQSVSITYPSVTDEVKEVSNNEDIELALKLTAFLKYDLFEQPNNEEEPLITIIYHLKDGTDKIISANNNVVWWNKKSYSIKDKKTFINLAEGIFFLEYVQEK